MGSENQDKSHTFDLEEDLLNKLQSNPKAKEALDVGQKIAKGERKNFPSHLNKQDLQEALVLLLKQAK